MEWNSENVYIQKDYTFLAVLTQKPQVEQGTLDELDQLSILIDFLLLTDLSSMHLWRQPECGQNKSKYRSSPGKSLGHLAPA